jgi:integrase
MQEGPRRRPGQSGLSPGTLPHPAASLKREETPRVYTRAEVRRILAELADTPRLVVALLYGSGLRLAEVLRLRVRDLDFRAETVVASGGEGARRRLSVLPRRLCDPLAAHLRAVRMLHLEDRLAGCTFEAAGNAGAWPWQYVFPATRRTADASGSPTRGHLTESAVRGAILRAARASGVRPLGASMAFRQSFAAHLLEAGYSPEIVGALLGSSTQPSRGAARRPDARGTSRIAVVREPMLGSGYPVDRGRGAEEEARIARVVAYAEAVLAPLKGDRARRTGNSPHPEVRRAAEPVVSPYDVLEMV